MHAGFDWTTNSNRCQLCIQALQANTEAHLGATLPGANVSVMPAVCPGRKPQHLCRLSVWCTGAACRNL